MKSTEVLSAKCASSKSLYTVHPFQRYDKKYDVSVFAITGD